MVLSAANYLSDEMIIKKLPFLTPEEADEVISKRKEDELHQFNDGEPDDESDEE